MQPQPRTLVGDAHPGLSPLWFGALATLLGAVTGFGAFAFRVLIAVIHNLAFLGRFSAVYDANAHTPPAPWGLAMGLVPAAGALLVVFLVQRFAPEAKGHGVPEVMDAIYYNKSIIRPIVAVIKSLVSAVSIGTGGSVGREGPIIQIGAAFASSSGGVAGVSRWQRATLVAAGGGAGIAATFNTPIGGLLFAVEVLLHEVSARTLVPVALATTTATYVGRFLFGNNAAFPVPPLHVPEQLTLLPTYVGLGILAAVASVAFIRMLYGTEDFFERVIPGRPYLRHVAGMLGVGALFVALFAWRGHYYVEGVGYATILDVLTGGIPSIPFLLLLFVLKLVATSTTLGSGASGGIFSPSLFLGATLGTAYALMLDAWLPGVRIDPAVFALAGMAGVVSGATGAAITAVVMMFEMTLDYTVVLPMLLTASVSYGLRRLIMSESIYTMKLVRRGHVMPEALQSNAHLVHHVGDVSLARADVVSPDRAPGTIDVEDSGDLPLHIVVVDEGRVQGVISRDWARSHSSRWAKAARIGDLPQSNFIVVSRDVTVFDLIARMQRARAVVAVVAEPAPSADAAPQVFGVITRGHIAEVLAEGMELFGD
jgi:chloride channel protein, CIC family